MAIKAEIIGKLYDAPEIRYTRDGSPYCRFKVVVAHSRKNYYGEWETTGYTTVSCSMWEGTFPYSKMAEVTTWKGKIVRVYGSLRMEKYEVEYEDGESETIRFLSCQAADVERYRSPKKDRESNAAAS